MYERASTVTSVLVDPTSVVDSSRRWLRVAAHIGFLAITANNTAINKPTATPTDTSVRNFTRDEVPGARLEPGEVAV